MNPEIEQLFNRDEKEVKKFLKQFGKGKTVPNNLPLYKFVTFAEAVYQTKSVIRKSTNPRLIILETWLILDYCVRQLIINGLQLEKFATENFDILPQGFRNCLLILSNLKKDQLQLKPNPYINSVSFPGGFISFFMENYREEFDKFLHIEHAFYKKYHPELVNALRIERQNPQYRNVDAGWFSIIENLNDEWFKKATKLNEVRNLAAHDFSPDNIYVKLGINGPNKIVKLKKYCNMMLVELIGLKG